MHQLRDDQVSGPYIFAPLKHRPTKSAKYARYIPIMDDKLAAILQKRTVAANELYKTAQVSGGSSDMNQYLLFPEITYQKISKVFSEVYCPSGIMKSYDSKRLHDTRHTYITTLLSVLGEVSIPFARDIWGHTDYRTISRYTHLATKMNSDKEKLATLGELKDRKIKAL